MVIILKTYAPATEEGTEPTEDNVVKFERSSYVASMPVKANPKFSFLILKFGLQFIVSSEEVNQQLGND
jgi:hypothetical protein